VRIKNTIYEDGIPLFRIASDLIDRPQLSAGGINYMNKYIKMYPEKIIPIEPMNRVIKMFYDLETTGTNSKKHSIHHISGLIEVDGEVDLVFDYKVRPHQKAVIEQEAMTICGVTAVEISKYPTMKSVHKKIQVMLSTYVDRFDNTDKIFLVGFNNRSFDDDFFRKFFELNDDPYFNAWFWSDSHDVMVLASVYLQERRYRMPAFKLKSVAKELGLIVDESKLHEADYDIELTREIYRIVTGLELEM
jgi:DNA polymerase-3 subunit epsilon